MLAAMRLKAVSVLFWAVVAGCAYPRYTTPLHAVPNPKLTSNDHPASLYAIKLNSADVPLAKNSGLKWDEDGSGPDPFVRLIVDGRLVWQSEVMTDQVKPQWNVELPANVQVASNSQFRLELWDFDTAVSADPIGQLEHRGLPDTALPGAEARLTFDNMAMVSITVNPPRAHKGVGLSVEARSDALKVYHVEPYSPASRAGIRVGELIVAVGNDRVSHMGAGDAVSELLLSVDRGHSLTVADASGKNEREVKLDPGYVWLVL